MEHKEIVGIPLRIFNDEVFKISYVSLLTEDCLQPVKLPTNFQNYKLQHLIRPNYLIKAELVKTKKNWILKTIHNFEEICQLETYQDHLKHTEIVNFITRYTREEQDLSILNFLREEFEKQPMSKINLLKFESSLLKQLGFTPKLGFGEKLAEKLHSAKLHNDLVHAK